MKTLFCKDLVSCVSLSKTYVSLFVFYYSDYICAESLDKKKTSLDLTGWKNDSPKVILPLFKTV